MSSLPGSVQARRYLLGQASEEECAVLEREYLEREDAVERIAAVEDDLIEDYLANALSPDDRTRFEAVYLPVPHHRVRVETVRRLMARASSASPAGAARAGVPAASRMTRRLPWLALAASVLVAAAAAIWLLFPSGSGRVELAKSRAPSGIVPTPPPPAPSQTPSPPPPAPRLFAVSLSPIGVRSASESSSVVIPSGTETVRLRLAEEADGRRLAARRVSIRTVTGSEAWRGRVASRDRRPGTAAELDVPAATVPADDYIVTLYGVDENGVEQEWTQYFLRVRAR